jgi:arabinosaccharide transport system permease protein
VSTVTEAASSRSFFQRPGVVAAVFLLPFIVFFLVFRVWAVIQAILLSFQKVEGFGGREWTGLSNYRDLAGDPLFFTALGNTALYTAGTLLLLIPIPFVLAAVLQSRSVKRPHAFRTVLFLPILTSLVVVGVVFQLLLNTDGIVNSALATVGLPRLRWLETKELAIPAMLIMAMWRWTGINIIYFTTGLANIPQDLYEAAAVDGASSISRFFHISVPLSKPIILFVTVLSLIGGFQLFVEPYILWPGAGGGPGRGGLSIVVLLYRSAFTSFRLGYAAAIGVVLALIIMAVSLLQFRFFGFFRKD